MLRPLSLICVTLFLTLAAADARGQRHTASEMDRATGSHPPMRSRSLFDADWSFHLGDVEGGENRGLDVSEWRTVRLPHDWSIEGSYAPDQGTDWQTGFLPAGIGWYRKLLPWSGEGDGTRLLIHFDGVYLNSDVWINGHHLGHRPNGYVGFEYDLTDYMVKGDNVIAVRVDHSKPLSGRWYTGSGIYRHVWLIQAEPVHIPTWGTFFRTPEVSDSQASFELDTEIVNTTDKDLDGILTTWLGFRGDVAAKVETPVRLPAGESTAVVQKGVVDRPHLWSPDTPDRYTVHRQIRLHSGVELNGFIVLNDSMLVGIRKVEFSPEWGMKLNGKRIKLKGVCEHHTAGLYGAAVPDEVLRQRLELLKKMGCNAVRTSHNPFSPTFYDLCDELGIMVLDEAFDGWEEPKAADDYGNYFNQWWERDLSDFIRRDRNHPSVIIWSIGNEVRKPTRETQKKLIDLVHRLDPTRPVTQGGHDPTRGMKGDSLPTQLDIKGFNGDAEEIGVLERHHQQHPDDPMLCTEVPHTYQTRGVYRTKTHWRRRDFPAPWEIKGGKAGTMKGLTGRVFEIPDLTEEEVFPEEIATHFFQDGKEIPIEIEKPWQSHLYYQSSYDNASVRSSARRAWQRTRDFDFVIGQFRWTGFDYLGETNQWPSRFANFGVIDICGFPKDHYYLYQSLWTEEPMVHLLPHWTHPGKEGVEIPVVAYTNCDSAELFLNGESLGSKTYEGEQLVWLVPYTPGELKVVATRNGETAATDTRRTAGDSAALKLTLDQTLASSSGSGTSRTEWIRAVAEVVDADGNVVPMADSLLNFEVSGPGKLIGIDNGDPLDLSSYRFPKRRAFRGKCLAVIRAVGGGAKVRVTVTAPGLKSAEAEVMVMEQHSIN